MYIKGNEMKKVKIPVEMLFKLFESGIADRQQSERDLKIEKIIDRNKKYFNHIGLA